MVAVFVRVQTLLVRQPADPVGFLIDQLQRPTVLGVIVAGPPGTGVELWVRALPPHPLRARDVYAFLSIVAHP
jgi:hypothetical protein